MEKIVHVLVIGHYDGIDNNRNNHNITGTQ